MLRRGGIMDDLSWLDVRREKSRWKAADILTSSLRRGHTEVHENRLIPRNTVHLGVVFQLLLLFWT